MVRGNQIGTIAATTGNYILSFEIVAHGTVSDWGSILHFTTGKDCCGEFGGAAPAIWFMPGTTKLGVYIGDSSIGNWKLESYDLPLNVRIKVIVECNGPNVKLSVGSSTVYTATQPARRVTGNLIVYAGDPWYPTANAEIYNVDYKILPARANAGKLNTYYD